MKRIAILATFAALGLAAALGLTAKPAAAWDIHSLPAAFHVNHISTTSSVCSTYYSIIYVVGDGTGAVSPDLCDNSPTFQQDLDAFVDSPCTAAGATCVPPPPPPVTTTAPATDPAPAPAPGTPDPTTTTTPAETVTVTTVITDPVINDRLAALEANYAALAKRVDAIAQANTASWDAFKTAIDGGSSVSDAALAARSAGENAIYQL